jgi:hemolysin activation/secretion protein
MAASLRPLLMALVLMGSVPAHGQQQSRPAPVDPRQSEKAFDAQRERQRLAKPPVTVPTISRSEPKADTKRRFVLTSISIKGATAIPTSAFADLYAPFVGKAVSEADLLSIANGISDRYRAAGYHLSRAIIPVQDIEGGRVRIQVIEGAFTDLKISGDDDNVFGAREILNVVLREKPSRLATLERQLLLLNDTPGLRVADTAIDEIGTATGRFRLIVKLKIWRVYQSLGLDNSGTRAAGPLLAYSTTAFNSAIAPGDSIAVNLSTVPDATRELRYGRVSYDVPVGVDGAKLGASVSRSEVWPGDGRRAVEDRTVDQGYELRASIAPHQTRKSAVLLSIAAHFSDPYEKTSFDYVYRDHVRQITVAANLKAQDPLDALNYLTVALRQGVDVWGATQFNDPTSSREDASPNSSVLAYAFARYQPLVDAWSLMGRVSGQVASGPLLTSQAYYLGGAAFGPGYVSGDNGFSGSVELRFDQTPQSTLVKGYQLYAFIDGGRVWDMDGEKLSLASAGAGVRMLLIEELTASFAVAFPVHYTFRTDEIGKARFLFSISNVFKVCPGRSGLHCV